MATCVQQITWHLKKDVLLKLLHDAQFDFSALEIKMCVEAPVQAGQPATIKFFVCLIDVDTNAQNPCAGAVTTLGSDVEVCPVPPDCNSEAFIDVLKKYFGTGEITFSLNQESFL